MSTQRGFTLVELLVAIAILAMVAVLGWRGLDGIVRSREALTAQMETTRGLQLAFAQLQSDGEHLADPATVHGRPTLAADDSQLVMVRSVAADNEPSRLQVVAYRTTNGVLTRSESQGTRDLGQLDVLWQAAVAADDASRPVALQAGVTALRVRLFQDESWRAPPTPLGARRRKAAPVIPAGVAAPGMRQRAPGPLQGMEVALRVDGQRQSMTKVFLLGGV